MQNITHGSSWRYVESFTASVLSSLITSTEVRNAIYEHAIPHDTAIELWPDEEINGKQLAKHYATKIASIVKLLRVCKQLCGELAPVFYSTNEFRFSGLGGIMVLASFLNTIGRNNRYLNKVSSRLDCRV